MRLELLKSFIAVVDSGSYARGANVLNLSQPTIYQHIRQLEIEYGVPLVTQLGKRVALTDSGRMFYEYARQMDGLTEDLRSALSASAGQLKGSLVLVAGTTLGDFVLPCICVRFQRRYPDVHITLRVQTPLTEVERAVRDHAADLGFSGQPTSGAGIVSLPFLEDELVVIVRPDHYLAGRSDVSAVELAEFPAVMPAASSFQSLRSILNTWFEEAKQRPRCIFEINSIEGIKSAVREGAGAGLVSRLVTREEDSSLVIVPVANAPRRRFYMLARTGGWQEGPSRAFRDYVSSGDWRRDGQ